MSEPSKRVRTAQPRLACAASAGVRRRIVLEALLADEHATETPSIYLKASQAR